MDDAAWRRRRVGAILALEFGSRVEGSLLGRVACAQRSGTISQEQAIGLAAALLDLTDVQWAESLDSD